MTKATYELPVLRAHGKVENITKGTSVGDSLDDSFPVSTPRGDLTFS